MRQPDIDRLLREERFDELARLGALAAERRAGRRSLGQRARTRGLALLAPARPAERGAVTIREAGAGDGAAIARLAELDERAVPAGALLVAEVGAEIVAALPLDGTAPLAHPLRSTAGLVDLLELRARQLGRRRWAA